MILIKQEPSRLSTTYWGIRQSTTAYSTQNSKNYQKIYAKGEFVLNNPVKYTDPSGHGCEEDFICNILTAPIQLVTDIANGVSNVGNPEYQLGSQSQEIALDIIKRAMTAPITGDFPDSSDYVVPAEEVSQNYQALGNTAGWTLNATGDAFNTAGVAGVVEVGVRSGISLLTQKGVASAGEGFVFRGGSSTIDNLTPRPGIDVEGLSTFNTLEAAVKPGQKAQVIYTPGLKNPLVAVPDPHIAPGHVSIRPGTGLTSEVSSSIEQWAATRGTGTAHPYTKVIQEAIVGEVKRPK